MEKKELTLLERYRGCFLGMAVGDALGTTLEDTHYSDSPKHVDMIGGGKFSLLPGQWTDDTTMALCMAESLIECKGFNPKDQLSRYLKWYREGIRGSNGQCFDIGITTRMSLEKFEKTNEDFPSSTGDLARAGNGSLMRLCPIPLFYRKVPTIAVEKAVDSSKTTHGAASCLSACKYFTVLLLGILEGASKSEILSERYAPESFGKDFWQRNPLVADIDEVALGSFKKKNPPEIVAAGHVTKSLEAVLWAFYTTDNFKDGLLKVVNLGGDADTTGAIYGQIAGAYYGENEVPKEWREKLAVYPLLDSVINQLYHSSELISSDVENSYVLSDHYLKVRDSYQIIEDGYKLILRKLLPGIHAYSSLDEFEKDVSGLEQKFEEKATVEGIPKKLLLEDFKRRIADERIKLTRKLSRPNPFANLKKV